MPSIVNKIEVIEHQICNCEERLDVVDRRLRLDGDLTEENRDELIIEENEIKQTLEKHRRDLRVLRKENFKSMVVSCVILASLYGLYLLLWT